MNYGMDIDIREHNKQAHLDIEKDIEFQQDGLFTFTLRISNGNIVDYAVVEYADSRKYLKLTKLIIEEYTVPLHPVVGSEKPPIRTDNSQHPVEKRSSTT